MANLLRVSIIGALPTGEIWSVNPVWTISDSGTPTTPAQIQAVSDGIAALSLPTGLLTAWNTNTNWNKVRVEARTALGTLENLAETVKVGPQAGTGTNNHPHQTAWVTSLRSTQAGATGRGRLYWPATGAGLSASTLRPIAPANTNMVDYVRTFLTAAQGAIRLSFTGANLAVWSRKTHGLFNVVTLEQGDVLDTQRRRRDTLVESRASASYPT